MGRIPVRTALSLLPTMALLGAIPAASFAKEKPKPKAAHGTLTMHVSGLMRVDGKPVTVPGRKVSVAGVLRPRVPGVPVQLRAYIDGHFVKREPLRLKGSDNGHFERYSTTFRAPRSGQVK